MGNENDIVLIVVSGTLLMMLFISVIILFAITYNRKMQKKNSEYALSIKEKELEMLKKIIETQESERDKIASNLHDEVGPLLSKLKLDMSSFKRQFEKGTLTVEKLDNEREFIDIVIENVRSVSHDLSPQFLLKFGIVKAIKNYVSNIENLKINVLEKEKEVHLSRTTSVNTYRILLELINNIIKHDNATEIEIIFEKTDVFFRVIILHDGKGISNEEFKLFVKNSKGLGLTSIQSRILILNAILDFENKTKGKSSIKLSMPQL